jgi:energy-coupling factor transport system permease protein
VIYTRRASPLHAARPAVAMAWCGALAATALVSDHPLVLGVLVGVIVLAGLAAGVGGTLRRAAWVAVPIGLMWLVIEPLVLRDGLTVIARLGELPPFGRIDITLEATVAGAIFGLRAVAVIFAFALYAAAVDPDEVLRLFRRRGMRSALTVTVATRMVGVLERDARRLDEGRRCRGTGAPSRLAVVRTVSSGAMDRALDVASALELRGYGARVPAASGRRRVPWSRHDVAFACSALAMVVLVVLGEATRAWGFDWSPRLSSAPVAEAVALVAAFAVVALLPFAERRGVAR